MQAKSATQGNSTAEGATQNMLVAIARVARMLAPLV